MEDLLKIIKKKGEDIGYDFIIRPTPTLDTYVIANKICSRVTLVGKTEDGDILLYKVNMRKWKWADAEGFTMDEMVDLLFDEIFIKVSLSEYGSTEEICDKITSHLK